MNRVKFDGSPFGMMKSLWNNHQLVWQMTKREVVGRYRGSFMGLVWSFFHPLLMLAVYTFVFSVVFQVRWSGEPTTRTDFAIILFVGIMIHGLFSECLNRSPGLVLSNANYVKKVVFPLEILPWVAMGSALFHFAASLGVFFVAFLVLNLHLKWTVLYLPAVLVPLVVLTMGISWLLAALGVFLRDVAQTTGIVTTILLFLSPVFFPVSALPEDYRALVGLNPLTFIIEQSRDVLIWGRSPDWVGLGIYFAIGLLVGWIGFAWFQTTRRGFADVV